MSRVGIMGGTFNPPHNGHVHAARQAMAAMQFDRLLLIPDNVPPHKTMPHGSADGEQRLEMTRLMAREIPGAEACDMELRRGGRSYTADTLRALQRALPEAELFLIIGTDMLLTLDNGASRRHCARWPGWSRSHAMTTTMPRSNRRPHG